MTDKERYAKMGEAVSQIGRLIAVCSENGLDGNDILIMLQTSTSLFCEMNDVEITHYTKHLNDLHNMRITQEAPRH